MQDAVEEFMAQWKRERPDVDVEAMGVIARLSRAGKLITASIRDGFLEDDIEPWEFDVLATLRRAGPPYTLTPKRLAAMSMVGNPAMTHRIDKLVQRGLVTRQVDPRSRRQLLVTLTPQGHRLSERLIEDHTANCSRFLHSLTKKELSSLDGLLKKLLVSRDDTPSLT